MLCKCPTHCPISGVNIKRFLLTLIAGFAFAFAYDWVVHGYLLTAMYEQTAHLWRPEAEMKEYCPFMLATKFFVVAITAFIFTRNYEGKGLGEGLRFGAYIGLLMGVMLASPYGWMPVSGPLAAAWFATGLIQGLGLGVIYALTYRK